MPDYDISITAYFRLVETGNGNGNGNNNNGNNQPGYHDNEDGNDDDLDDSDNDMTNNQGNSNQNSNVIDDNEYQNSETDFSIVDNQQTQLVNPENSDETGFDQVSFKLKKATPNVTFRIKRLNTDEFVSKEIPNPNKKVIKYLDIDLHSNKGTVVEKYLGDDDIESMSFRFTLKRLIIKNSNIDPASIKLIRYHNGRWTELETRFISGVDNGS